MRSHAHLALGVAGAALISDARPALLGAAGLALLPDLPYGICFAQQAVKKRLRGLGAGDLFESWTWIRAAWLLHSLPVFALALAVSWWAGPSWLFEAVLAGWGSHLAADALTHVKRPYPFFYPLSRWRFRGVASYWEAGHHAGAVRMVEWALVVASAVWLAARWGAAPL